MPPKRGAPKTRANQPAPQRSTRSKAKATAPVTTAPASSPIVAVTPELAKDSKKRGTRRNAPQEDVFVFGGLGSPEATKQVSRISNVTTQSPREGALRSRKSPKEAAVAQKAPGRAAKVQKVPMKATTKAPSKSPLAVTVTSAQKTKADDRDSAKKREMQRLSLYLSGSPSAVTRPTSAVAGNLMHKAVAPAAVTRPTSKAGHAAGQATPLAADTSIAALANFRRRPRQPSLLHALANPSADDTSLTLETTMDTMDIDVDTTTQSIAFAPDDEGTPLPGALSLQPRIPPPMEDDDLYTVSPQPKRGRKRKSDDISGDQSTASASVRASGRPAVMRSSPPEEIEVPASQLQDLVVPDADAPIAESTSSLSQRSTPPAPPSTRPGSRRADVRESRSSTPRRVSDNDSIYADPMSSSPPASPLSSPPAPVPAKNARRTETGGLGRKAVATTAMLRALLPKRIRREVNSEQEDSESEDAASEVEVRQKGSATTKRGGKVTGKTVGAGRRVLAESPAKRNARIGPAKGMAGKGKGKSKRSAVVAAAEKENAGARQGRKVYGRRSTEASQESGVSDAEEEEADGDGEGEEEERQGRGRRGGLSKELQAARDKFRAIDEGELEFESASLGGGSSPWR